MTYYCNECSEWINSPYESKVMEHEGRFVEHRWCNYDRRWRAYNQKIYNCGGFIYVRRAVLTKICEILNINPCELFNAFDEVKENYIIANNPELLTKYNNIASYIVNGLDIHPEKETLAKSLFNSYIIDAEANIKMHNYDKAVNLYSEMIKALHIMFDVINDRSLFHDLAKIR